MTAEDPLENDTENRTSEDPTALASRLEEEKARAESHYASWQRSAADFVNYRRRAEQERSESIRFGNASLILHLLPVIDDLERALQNLPKELLGLTWVDGIHLIHRKLAAVLEAQGTRPIEAVGHAFDPNLHEAVLREPGDEGKVLSELQRGYTLHGRVIRPSLVKVGEGGAPAPPYGSSSESPAPG
ncbi:MAG: nucleotide exchange factor GrpE [Dehalococcoidia bacterium]|nr:nucleotide exchange factor GrpE [Dehalococcoidia bacterium]